MNPTLVVVLPVLIMLQTLLLKPNQVLKGEFLETPTIRLWLQLPLPLLVEFLLFVLPVETNPMVELSVLPVVTNFREVVIFNRNKLL